MKKLLIIIFGFWMGVVLFLPKENLFFTLQNFLKNENVFINCKSKENILSLDLENSVIFVNKMDLVKIRSIKVLPILFYNEIDIKKISISAINLKLSKVKIYHSILYPIKVFIKGNNLNGEIDLFHRNLKIYLIHPSKNIKNFLKKDNKGYYYAQKF